MFSSGRSAEPFAGRGQMLTQMPLLPDALKNGVTGVDFRNCAFSNVSAPLDDTPAISADASA